MVHGGGLEALSKIFLIPLGKGPMANETYFLIGERAKFMETILSESAIGKKNNLIISKYEISAYLR